MSRAKVCVAGAILLVSSCLFPARSYSQQGSPKPVAAAAPTQPIPFSHKTHVGFGLACNFCHANPDPGNQMTLPATTICMGCHSSVATDRPSIQQLTKFAQAKEPVPWKQVYSVPAFVYWSHRVHLAGGVTCQMCHGDVAQMEVMTKTTNVTTMAGCVACHRQKNAATGCETCHESQSSFLRHDGELPWQ